MSPRFHVLPLVRRLAAVERCLVVAITERVIRCFVAEISEDGRNRLVPLALPLPRGGRAAHGELLTVRSAGFIAPAGASFVEDSEPRVRATGKL